MVGAGDRFRRRFSQSRLLVHRNERVKKKIFSGAEFVLIALLLNE